MTGVQTCALPISKQLGIIIELPEKFYSKKANILEKDKRLLFIFDGKGFERETIPGWWYDEKKRTFHHIFNLGNVRAVGAASENSFDEIVRLVLSEGHEQQHMWFYHVPSFQEWVRYPRENLGLALKDLGHKHTEIPQILGSCANDPWKLITIPFEDEYPGNKTWNLYSPELAYEIKKSSENLYYPTWTKILEHLGKNLTVDVSLNSWCKYNGILTGTDYIKVWVARLFQKPLERLPYLFFYSPGQGTGKSTFHRALKSLMHPEKNGCVNASEAIRTNFNSELIGKILCVLEETNFAEDKSAYDKVKPLITEPTININEIGRAHV